ncbi:hypothetical protein KC19_5G053100 [Ceratodon purpureus]|uniref:Uncharacterized protein n=1 Tax=Ceratodon purpureus TaxID=3225 RepID=A0A8T0HZI9_CERPU|nr:hypothetical protein KC19_5G053100 [Ceratodon purpureus]
MGFMSKLSPKRVLDKDPRRHPRAIKEEETLPPVSHPDWKGVLAMENHQNELKRIAKVTSHPPLPVPLQEVVQVNKKFMKLDLTRHQLCVGLPFFELYKANYKYSPESEWCKFLNYMYVEQKFATIICEGWELYVRPPLEGPPHGFASVRVHYKRLTEAPTTEVPTTGAPGTGSTVTEVPTTTVPISKDPMIDNPVTEAPKAENHVPEAPKVEDSVTKSHKIEDPVTKTPMMKAPTTDTPMTEPRNLKEADVLRGSAPSEQERVSEPTSVNGDEIEAEFQAMQKRASDFMAEVCHVPKRKRPRGEGEFRGFGNTVTDAPSSIQDRDVQKTASKSSETPESSGNHVFNDISPNVDHVRKPPKGKEIKTVVEKRKGASNVGSFGGGNLKSDKDWLEEYLKRAEAKTPKPSGSESAQGGVKRKLSEMVVSHGATLGAGSATEERMGNYFDESPVPKAPCHGDGIVKKPSEPSGSDRCRLNEKIAVSSNRAKSGASARGKLSKSLKQSVNARQKSSQLNEKPKGVQSTSPVADVPKPSTDQNGDFTVVRDTQVVEKSKGRVSNGVMGDSLKKQLPKPSLNGNGGIKLRAVQALPVVPESFRAQLSSDAQGLGLPKEQMVIKPPSSANEQGDECCKDAGQSICKRKRQPSSTFKRFRKVVEVY